MHKTSPLTLSATIRATLVDLNGFLRQAGLYLVIVILAAGGSFMFQNLMAVDEWWSYSDIADYQTSLTVSSGRPIFALISALALNAFPIHPFDTVLFFAALTLFAFVVFGRWTTSCWLRLLIISLFVTSPFLVEHMQFTVNQIPLSLALLLISFWFLTIAPPEGEGRRPGWFLGILAGTLAGGIAIATRNELVFLMFGAGVIEAARARLQDGRSLAASLSPMLVSLIIAGALGVVLIFGALIITGAEFTRGGNIGTNGLVASPQESLSLLQRFRDYWLMFLFEPHYLFPSVVKVLVWVIAVSAIMQSLLARDYARLFAFLVVGLLLSAVPLSLGLVSHNFPYQYAAVMPLALFTCFLVSLAVTVPGLHPFWRWLACTAGVAIVVVSAANLSTAQVRLANLNRRDISTMTQFLAAIRASGVPDWKIALLGSYTGEINPGWVRSRELCSAFECTQALAPLLRLTLLEHDPQRRIFTLTDNERASFQPDLDALPVGSSVLVRLDQQRFVVLLK